MKVGRGGKAVCSHPADESGQEDRAPIFNGTISAQERMPDLLDDGELVPSGSAFCST